MIVPLGEGAKDLGRWGGPTLLFMLAAAFAGGLTGSAVAGLRSVLLPLPLFESPGNPATSVSLFIGVAALMAAAHELGFMHLPVPQRSWQVPKSWVLKGRYRGIGLFGAGLGVGFLTYSGYLTFHILIFWIAITGNILYGGVLGAVFGMARGLPVLIVGLLANTRLEGSLQDMHWLVKCSGSFHQVNGFVLSVLGSALLVGVLA